jgi:hypothetical protein
LGKPGQGVEERRFAGIGIADERQGLHTRRRLHNGPAIGRSAMRRGEWRWRRVV